MCRAASILCSSVWFVFAAGQLSASLRSVPCSLPSANPKVSTTIRLSRDVIDHFKSGGRGWQTRIDAALREWIAKHDVA